MTALPAATAFTGSGVTEGAFKTAMTDQRAFLSELLGADGVPSTARAALGVPAAINPVVSGVMTWSDLANFAVMNNSGLPWINFDVSDYLSFDRSTNKFIAVIGAIVALALDSSQCVGVNDTTPSASGRLSVVESASRPAMIVRQSAVAQHTSVLAAESETYAASVCSLQSWRPANTAYNFLAAASDSNGTPDTEFLLRGDGNAFADGSFTGSGADYQEYFQSVSGRALEVGITVVLDGELVRPAIAGDRAEDVIGVVRPKEDNKNSAVIGNAAWNHWSEKYLTDPYGRYLIETYRVFEWEEEIPAVTRTVERQKVRTSSVRRVEPVVVAGRAEMRVMESTVDEPVFDTFPLFDERGSPVLAEQFVYDANGVPVMTETVALDERGDPVLVDGKPGVIKQPVKRRQQVQHRVPVMELIEEVVTPATTKKHVYAEGKVPEGIAVPRDARVTEFSRRKLNPDYREGAEYTPRHERPEWNLIGLLGQVQIADGAPVNPRWVRMRQLAEGVSLWFIR